ncbi:MAG: hypothetical protein IKG87_05175 [Clostridia bacterium]|nr:hypothetical protein [Clostridia bacterium]
MMAVTGGIYAPDYQRYGVSVLFTKYKALKALTDDTVTWQEGKGIRKGATAEEIMEWVKELALQ